MALADWLRPPKVVATDLADWTGAPGGRVRGQATDDFLVRTVRAACLDAAGGEVEAGLAVPAGAWWVYTLRTAAPAGARLRLTAVDLPGHAVAVAVPAR